MRNILFAVLWVAGVSVAVAAGPVMPTKPTRMDVFTSADYPLSGASTVRDLGIDVRVYDLDAPGRIAAQLSKGLPSDPEKAREVAMGRLQGHEQAWGRQAAEAWVGAVQARSWGLTRYPAVVFNEGEAVIYGETDVVDALHLYREWRQAQRRTQKVPAQ